MSVRFKVLGITACSLGTASLALFACGGDTPAKKKIDGSINVIDAPGSGSACAIAASFSPTFGSNNSNALNLGSAFGSGTQADRWVGVLGTAQTDPELNIIIFSDGSAADTPDWPTLALGAKSGLTLSTDPTADFFSEIAANFDGSGAPQDEFAATAGTLNITAAGSAIGSTFSGSISNAVFTHGTFDNQGAFTADADGCTSTIANATFTATLAAGFGKGTQPGTQANILRHRFK